MTGFVKIPNIPQGRVTTGIVSGENEELLNYLKSFGIKCLLTDENNKIDKFISNHADVNLHHLGSNRIIADDSQSPTLIQNLKSLGFEVLPAVKQVSGKYPDDCRLNHARVGNYLIGKQDVCDNGIIKHCIDNGIARIDVKQGYCKCSICIVNERAIITDDISIKRASSQINVDCLLIDKGDIKLRGYGYGFVGGASALIDKDKLLFFGNLKHHRNYREIVSFLNRYHCSAVFSEDFELTDIGGMIPLIVEN